MSEVVKVNDDIFEEEVLKSKKPVIVDFWAGWCMPCKMIAPVVDEIAKEYKDRIKCVKMDVDENTKVATDYTVMNIPTLLFFKGGQEVGRVVGVVSKRDLLKKIQDFFHE